MKLSKLKIIEFVPLVAVSIFVTGCDLADKKVLEMMQLPGADFDANLVYGRSLFDTNCATCHGPGGGGTAKGPPLVERIYRPGHHGDVSFYVAVERGVRQHHWRFGDMPAIDGLTTDDVGHIVAYVRDEQGRANIR